MRLLKGSWNAAVNFILSLQLHNVWRTWIQRGQLLISPLPTSIFLESTWIKRNLPMESVCRWELHVQKVLQMCEGWWHTSNDCFHLGFLICSGRCPPNTSTAITALLTWEYMRPWKEKFSFPHSFLNPASEGHHTPHLDFLYQRCPITDRIPPFLWFFLLIPPFLFQHNWFWASSFVMCSLTQIWNQNSDFT